MQASPQRSPVAAAARNRRAAAAVAAATLAASPVRQATAAAETAAAAAAPLATAAAFPCFDFAKNVGQRGDREGLGSGAASPLSALRAEGRTPATPPTAAAAAGAAAAAADAQQWSRCTEAATSLSKAWNALKLDTSSNSNSGSRGSSGSGSYCCCCSTRLYGDVARLSWQLQHEINALLLLLPAEHVQEDAETAAALSAAATAAAAAAATDAGAASTSKIWGDAACWSVALQPRPPAAAAAALSAAAAAAAHSAATAAANQTPQQLSRCCLPSVSTALRLVRALGLCSCEAAEGSNALLLLHRAAEAAAGAAAAGHAAAEQRPAYCTCEAIQSSKPSQHPGGPLHKLLQAAAEAAAQTYGSLLSIESLLRALAAALRQERQQQDLHLLLRGAGSEPFAAWDQQLQQQQRQPQQQRQLQQATQTLQHFLTKDFEGLASAVVSRCMAGLAALQQHALQQQQRQQQQQQQGAQQQQHEEVLLTIGAVSLFQLHGCKCASL
ncbi:hypothetical protein, conserved [Eimeria tenella]|uniref:Uncharacterized protein n=1 Tax=Eimeria tenella TaxID=5802 RepID=U6KQK4_EIMTE|nr:hypothetical protein, conserved [Eimeria tenella]CDJ39198.1 hypothetical protein, conserved [Eimeria tenella]|eukprot:XP_013229953.1 hypothetical protein, conserved [Eimeria tenella]